MTRIPMTEGVFTWPSDEPRLIGAVTDRKRRDAA